MITKARLISMIWSQCQGYKEKLMFLEKQKSERPTYVHHRSSCMKEIQSKEKE